MGTIQVKSSASSNEEMAPPANSSAQTPGRRVKFSDHTIEHSLSPLTRESHPPTPSAPLNITLKGIDTSLGKAVTHVNNKKECLLNLQRVQRSQQIEDAIAQIIERRDQELRDVCRALHYLWIHREDQEKMATLPPRIGYRLVKWKDTLEQRMNNAQFYARAASVRTHFLEGKKIDEKELKTFSDKIYFGPDLSSLNADWESLQRDEKWARDNEENREIRELAAQLAHQSRLESPSRGPQVPSESPLTTMSTETTLATTPRGDSFPAEEEIKEDQPIPSLLQESESDSPDEINFSSFHEEEINDAELTDLAPSSALHPMNPDGTLNYDVTFDIHGAVMKDTNPKGPNNTCVIS